MKTSRIKLAHTIADRTLRQGGSKSLSREVAAYLLHEGKVSELESVLRDVQAQWAEAGFIEVIATSAHALSSANKTEITSQVKRLYPNVKTIAITEIQDPSVIGSVRLELANQQLDLSIEAKLNKFKQLTAAGKD